jgi:hypothetical protein
MAGQMTVVAVAQTGHMLGALTGTAPAGKTTVADVAGDALPVRIDATSFAIPATELAVAELGFDARVFEDPRDARVVFASPPDQDAALGFLISGVHGEVELPLTGDTLTVKTTAATAPTEDTPFWVLFQGPAGEPPVVVTGKIPAKKKKSGAVAHGLTSGATYQALVLLAGFAPHLQASVTPP